IFAICKTFYITLVLRPCTRLACDLDGLNARLVRYRTHCCGDTRADRGRCLATGPFGRVDLVGDYHRLAAKLAVEIRSAATACAIVGYLAVQLLPRGFAPGRRRASRASGSHPA